MELDIAPFDRGQISWGPVEGEAMGGPSARQRPSSPRAMPFAPLGPYRQAAGTGPFTGPHAKVVGITSASTGSVTHS
jgi:hypothetical protein